MKEPKDTRTMGEMLAEIAEETLAEQRAETIAEICKELIVWAALIGWVLLVIIRALGIIDMHWAIVLTSGVWITWGICALIALAAVIMHIIAKLRRRRRLRKVRRRIMKQAKAAGAWNVEIAGGKALDAFAVVYSMERQPGETDAEMRQRLREAIESTQRK